MSSASIAADFEHQLHPEALYSDGDVIERQTPSKDIQGGVAELIASQIADGFVEGHSSGVPG